MERENEAESLPAAPSLHLNAQAPSPKNLSQSQSRPMLTILPFEPD
jgi:hypothetical protein